MNNKALITGATGATGQEAIKRLLELKIPVRAMVHRIDERSELLKQQGVEIVQGDLTDFESVVAALEGISTAYFVYPIQVPGILEATAYFAQAALEQKLNLIVNMSQITARRTAKSHGAQNHWLAERVWDRSGVPVTHLRPTLFAEWLMYQYKSIKNDNRFVLPFADGIYAPIAAEDQGRVIAAILADPIKHAAKTYSLYGPQEMNQYEIASTLSAVVGREITYVPVEIDVFKKMMEADLNIVNTPWFIQHVGAIAQDCRDGIMAGTNDLVFQLTGQQPITIKDYIIKNINLFK
jgi:NAD(P)H dehydrogenase (quinone)